MNGRSAECGVRSAEHGQSESLFAGLRSALRAPSSALLLLALFIVPAFAQDKSVQEKRVAIEQSGIQPTIQMGRPIPTWWDVRVAGSAMVEGRFEFVLMNEGRVLANYTTEELALTGPQQRIRVLLPPVDDRFGVDQLQVQVTFRGKRFTEKLGQHILRVAMARSRTFMMLTSTSRLASKRSVERDRVMKRLAFESMATASLEDSVKTIPALFEPNDLPQEPMTYCAYDLVVLFGDEFRATKKPQLDALTAWIRAGGSFYVEPTGVLEPYHIDFLRGLTANDSRGLFFQPDSFGVLMPGTVWEEERIITTTTGLGRVAIRIEEDDAPPAFESQAWRRATAFLWKLRTEQVEAVAELGRFDLGDFSKQTGWLSMKLPTSTGELLDRLMPEGVRMVPLWLLGFILLGFVVMIGPVDYIGLGWLKARKYTWVTFPLATVAVTALTVWVSNTYMSSAEARRGLVIRDVDEDGSIVRTNRFELLFVASSHAVTTDMRKGVFSPLGTGGSLAENATALYQQQLMQQQMMLNQQGRFRINPGPLREDGLGGEKSPPRMSGRIPTQFEVTQDLAKWTPQLNRMFWIPGAIDEQPVDWKALVDDEAIRAFLVAQRLPYEEGRLLRLNKVGNDDPRTIPPELTRRVRQQFGSQAMVALLGPNGTWASDGNRLWQTSIDNNANPYNRTVMSQYNPWGVPTGLQIPPEVQQQGALFRWFYQHSVAQKHGLFGLASHIGPKGGPELDDLPIYDPSDSGHALLIVLVPQGDDLIAYRKRVAIGK